MANTVTNMLKVKYGDFKSLRDFILSPCEGKLEVDVNKLVPMPEDLNIRHVAGALIASGCMGRLGKWFGTKGITEEHRALAKKYKENIKKYGHPTWVSWKQEHWGTDRGAWDTSVEEENKVIRFSTATLPIKDLILKLSKQFPTTLIVYSWSCREDPVYEGDLEMLDGKVTCETTYQVTSLAAWKHYEKLNPDIEVVLEHDAKKNTYKAVDFKTKDKDINGENNE